MVALQTTLSPFSSWDFVEKITTVWCLSRPEIENTPCGRNAANFSTVDINGKKPI